MDVLESASGPSNREDKPGEECGVFGVYYQAPTDNSEAARSTFFGLYALQHRGQESCGIATTDGRTSGVFVHKGMGLVSQVFTESSIKGLHGHCAVGHNRYSTEGGSELRNAQPFVLDTILGPLGLAHNGTITRYQHLRKLVMQRGVGLFTSSDSELIAQLLAGISSQSSAEPATWDKAISEFMKICEGAFALVLLTRDSLYGVRDRHGLRPLCVGEIKKDDSDERLGYCLASESCALSTIGATYLREVRPGEIVRIDKSGLHSSMGCPPAATPALCVFEYVYFSRPDTLLEDQLVHQVRQELGKRLALEAPCPGADAVVPVPDSSFPAAIAYALATGIPFMEGLTKNRYIGRTFIQPDNRLRQRGVKIKFNPLPQNLKGKSVVLIDDSIVRGNTLGPIVKLLRDVGAKAVHVRISSPPVKHPCFMGIDMSTYNELIAHQKTVEQIRAHSNADSLAYISIEGMMAAVEAGLAEGKPKGHCNACFSGKYPIDIEEIVKSTPAERDARAKDTC